VEAYDGPQIVGMDLHRRRSVLVRMAEDGRKLSTARITNSPARLAAEIRRAGLHPKVVLEACYGWYWASGALAEAGAEVHLAHPLGVKAFSHRRVKNDELDARDLADLLRMGRLPEAWIAPAELRELREITRYHAERGPGSNGEAAPARSRENRPSEGADARVLSDDGEPGVPGLPLRSARPRLRRRPQRSRCIPPAAAYPAARRARLDGASGVTPGASACKDGSCRRSRQLSRIPTDALCRQEGCAVGASRGR
jgi:Transposase